MDLKLFVRGAYNCSSREWRHNCNYEMALHFDGENVLRNNIRFPRHRYRINYRRTVYLISK